MGDFKVSVCVVTYNHEPYIAQTLESILAQQTNFPFEIVIGEDCSTDNTGAIVRAFAARHPDVFRPFLNERNWGGKANFMRTYAACRAPYVAMLDGDDYWTSPSKLQRQIDALEAHPDWALCFHPAQCVYVDGSREPVLWPSSWDRPEGALVDLFTTNFVPTNAVVYRNGLLTGLPDWFRETPIGDWPLHMLHAVHGKIGFLPEVMSVYRVHARGAWSGLDRVEQLKALFKMFSLVDHHFAGKYAREIDAYRIEALSQLVNEISSAKCVSQDIDSLQAAYALLMEENRGMIALRDLRRRSFASRLAREAVRPWKQLRNRLRRFAA